MLGGTTGAALISYNSRAHVPSILCPRADPEFIRSFLERAILPQRHQEQCSNITDLDDAAKLWQRILKERLGLQVGKMDYLLALN